jgi:hypothetical protein
MKIDLPLSKMLSLAGMVLTAFVLGIGLGYDFAREPYRAVGLNSGKLDEAQRVQQVILDALGSVESCAPQQIREGRELVAIKANPRTYIGKANGVPYLCTY